jgi:hypothetical protein
LQQLNTGNSLPKSPTEHCKVVTEYAVAHGTSIQSVANNNKQICCLRTDGKEVFLYSIFAMIWHDFVIVRGYVMGKNAKYRCI